MGIRSFKRSLVVGCVLALAVPAVAQARTLYGTTSNGKLVQFADKASKVKTTTKSPIGAKAKKKAVQVKSTRTIVNLPAGVGLVGVDFRPKTGELFGIGSNSVVYRVLLNETKSARVLQVGAGFAPGLIGGKFGVDFNPVPDAIRVISDARQNLRVSPITGAQSMGSPDTVLPGTPSIVGAGYSNSGFSDFQAAAGSTTLFTIDSTSNTLNTQGGPGGMPSPNLGQQFPVGPLGIDVSSTVGFDVTGPFGNPAGLLANGANGKTTLYRVNLINGSTTKIGDVVTVNKKGKVKKTNLTGLAAVQD